MTKTESRCPHCGQPMKLPAQKDSAAAPAVAGKSEDREYDHRGVLMPRRTRLGGIIMPQ